MLSLRLNKYPSFLYSFFLCSTAAMHVKSDFFLYKSGVYKYTGLTNDTDNVAGDAVGWHSLRILGWGVDKSNPSNHRKYWVSLVQYMSCMNI